MRKRGKKFVKWHGYRSANDIFLGRPISDDAKGGSYIWRMINTLGMLLTNYGSTKALFNGAYKTFLSFLFAFWVFPVCQRQKILSLDVSFMGNENENQCAKKGTNYTVYIGFIFVFFVLFEHVTVGNIQKKNLTQNLVLLLFMFLCFCVAKVE